MTTTTDPAAAFHAAIAGAGLPDGLAWSVEVSARRKHIGATIEPGGAVVFKVPAGTAPERVTDAVRKMCGWVAVAAADMRDRGAYIARKELVNGEGFPFAGTSHRLRLVDDSDTGRRCPCQCNRLITEHPGVPIVAERGHPTWSGHRTWQLTLRRDAASARTVIEWYRAQGQAWLDAHMPELFRRLHVPADAVPTWSVRPYRAGQGYGGSWGVYRPAGHVITFNWMIFQFPVELLRYIAAHEAAHAALRGKHAAHGREWQLLVSRLVPEWRGMDPRARTAAGLVLWAGELEPPRAEPVAVHRAHAVTSGPYCLAYDNNPATGTRTPDADRSTFVRADVTCPDCLATYAPGGDDPARLAADANARHAAAPAPFVEPEQVDVLAAETRRVVRHFQSYTAEQRADRAASHRLGPRQRQAVGEYFYTHPDVPDRAFESRKAAARAGVDARAATLAPFVSGWSTVPAPVQN